MRGTTNAVQSNLPRNVSNSYISTVVFGANTYDGWYYSSMLGMPNADKVTITLEGMGVVGESWWTGSTLASKIAMDQTPIGLIFRCNDASVVGKACNPLISIVGGGLKRLARCFRHSRGC